MYKITYHQKVVDMDIPKLSKADSVKIQKSIIEKLCYDPVRFGKFLTGSLYPLRSLRAGDYRIVYSIEKKNEVFVVLIEHRSVAYKFVYKRI